MLPKVSFKDKNQASLQTESNTLTDANINQLKVCLNNAIDYLNIIVPPQSQTGGSFSMNLSDYTTKEELALLLNEYVRQQILLDYFSKNQTLTLINQQAYTRDEINNILKEYFTKIELFDALKQYYVKSEIDNILSSNYYTKTNININFNTKDEITNLLKLYYTKNEIYSVFKSVQIMASTVSEGEISAEVQYTYLPSFATYCTSASVGVRRRTFPFKSHR